MSDGDHAGGAAERGPALRRGSAPGRRQPGAPNYFDLHRPARAAGGKQALGAARAAALAAGILLLAFLLAGVRFWAGNAGIAAGLGFAAADAEGRVLAQVGDALLRLDRRGMPQSRIPLAALGISGMSGAALKFEFAGDGTLLVLEREADRGWADRLRAIAGAARERGGRLLRCDLEQRHCRTLRGGLGPADFAAEARTGNIYLADAGAKQLRKLNAQGETLAIRDRALMAPARLALHEGILYLIQAGDAAAHVLKPDARDFGRELDRISLTTGGGQLLPRALAWDEFGRGWALMRSADGSNAALRIFSPRWALEEQARFPAGAQPQALIPWGAAMLAPDPALDTLHRFDSRARAAPPFAQEAIAQEMAAQQSRRGFSGTLQMTVLLVLAAAAAAFIGLSRLQKLHAKIYVPPQDEAEAGLDINSTAIEWLAPAAGWNWRMRTLGYAIAGLAVAALLAAAVLGASLWTAAALGLLIAGLCAYYIGWISASCCHLGRLGPHLVLVDHNSAYRMARGSKIQYYGNFVMAHNIIVYLGNPLHRHFNGGALKQEFLPLVRTGIKVDHTTLGIRLFRNRHPLALGAAGFAVAGAGAMLLLLLT